MYNRPLPSKKRIFLAPIFLREGTFVHRLVGPKTKKKGGCVAASTDFRAPNENIVQNHLNTALLNLF